ncbi:TadE/TadG family type IV pilus assembly protein [Glaciimonas sp. PCH181]|uniref:TadE/TadG family type IV pilus assembly protein n=1 Tax=Glaciimonas sp. PCH181 TaxID=2133943 RepID=UPI000D338310|nr:TadE/TadG family type IV pilus assembly protein [Glaciimonas sp. PCH181]PUA17741.1 pilus assembly protein TadE [Glaciimonas sp. PCH181]
MKNNQRISRLRRACSGIVAVEFALILPVLTLLSIPVVDCARAIQANTILINISREGANIASRGASLTSTSSQNLMTALASTAPPLDMSTRGMIYISKVMGHLQGGVVRNVILEQYRWQGSTGYFPASTISTCSNWASDGSCSSIPSNPDSASTANAMTGLLADGEVVYAVEAFYNFNMFFNGLNVGTGTIGQIGPNLYAATIF